MRRVITLLILMFACCLPGVAQGTLQLQVDGATDPTDIPITSSYLMIFREMVANTTTPQSQKIGLVGFTNAADVTTFQGYLNQFQAQYLSENSYQQGQLATSLETELNATLTSDGQQQFQAYAQAHRYQMAIWNTNQTICGPTCNICTSATTSYDVFLDNYGTDNSEYEAYGDAIGSVGNCSCTVSTTSSVTVNGVITGGTKQGNNSTTSMHSNES